MPHVVGAPAPGPARPIQENAHEPSRHRPACRFHARGLHHQQRRGHDADLRRRPLPAAEPGCQPGAPPRTSAAPSPSTAPRPVAASTVYRGAKAVSAANLGATVEPDSRSMRGASWYIDDADQTRIYRIATAPGRVTTILLPPGERFNGAVGGDVEGFLINVTYAGPRPAVSILPRSGQGRGNLQLVTTGGFYSFELQVNRSTALNLVDIGDQPASIRAARGRPAATGRRLHPAGVAARGRGTVAGLGARRGVGRQLQDGGAVQRTPAGAAGPARRAAWRAADHLPQRGRRSLCPPAHQPAGHRGRAAARFWSASGSRSIRRP